MILHWCKDSGASHIHNKLDYLGRRWKQSIRHIQERVIWTYWRTVTELVCVRPQRIIVIGTAAANSTLFLCKQFQNPGGDVIGVHVSTASGAICRVSLALSHCLVHYASYWSRVSGDDTMIPPGFLASWAATMRLIQIKAPSEHEYRYVNSKEYHSINVQIACDTNYNIFNLVARWPGCTHDAFILW